MKFLAGESDHTTCSYAHTMRVQWSRNGEGGGGGGGGGSMALPYINYLEAVGGLASQ